MNYFMPGAEKISMQEQNTKAMHVVNIMLHGPTFHPEVRSYKPRHHTVQTLSKKGLVASKKISASSTGQHSSLDES